MTARFVTSTPTERSFQRDKAWQHPSRREHVHGRIRPMHQPRRCGLNSMCNAGIVAFGIAIALLCARYGWSW